MHFERETFFSKVRKALFGGSLTQQQVTGMEFDLSLWEKEHANHDTRWLAYCLATEYHETGARMWPVREGFKETDAAARRFVSQQGYKYAKPDPTTGEVYYGRGKVQITWADNYKQASRRLDLDADDDLYWHPDKALDLKIATDNLYIGSIEGWYRSDSRGKHTLARYFDRDTNDAFNAREIINGDKNRKPSWATTTIGNMIKGYHLKFLTALEAAEVEGVPIPEPPVIEPEPLPPIVPPVVEPEPEPAPVEQTVTVYVSYDAPPGVKVVIELVEK